MSSLQVAILGHGIIGGGVSRILLSDSKALQEKTGERIELAAICTLNPKEDYEIYTSHPDLFQSVDDVFSDSKISIICETIGGTGIAFEYVKKALKSGKHVVTANKKMMALHFQELYSLAQENGVCIMYEAAIGGGIPIISAIKNGIIGDNIQEIEGILNGTTNFILTKMEETGGEYGDILKEAQERGYAEADPSDDVDGFDSAYKLSLLITLAFKKYVSPQEIAVQGISSLNSIDFQYAKILGKKIKLVSSAKNSKEKIFARVSPVLFPKESRIAKTSGVLNAINCVGEYNTIGNFLSGEGAGRMPTASAIVSDIANIAKWKQKHASPYTPSVVSAPKVQSWYIRFLVIDKPGIIGDIGTIFGKYNVSIDAVHQFNHKKNPAHFIVTTLPAAEKDFKKALSAISAFDFNAYVPFALPIR